MQFLYPSGYVFHRLPKHGDIKIAMIQQSIQTSGSGTAKNRFVTIPSTQQIHTQCFVEASESVHPVSGCPLKMDKNRARGIYLKSLPRTDTELQIIGALRALNTLKASQGIIEYNDALLLKTRDGHFFHKLGGRTTEPFEIGELPHLKFIGQVASVVFEAGKARVVLPVAEAKEEIEFTDPALSIKEQILSEDEAILQSVFGGVKLKPTPCRVACFWDVGKAYFDEQEITRRSLVEKFTGQWSQRTVYSSLKTMKEKGIFDFDEQGMGSSKVISVSITEMIQSRFKENLQALCVAKGWEMRG